MKFFFVSILAHFIIFSFVSFEKKLEKKQIKKFSTITYSCSFQYQKSSTYSLSKKVRKKYKSNNFLITESFFSVKKTEDNNDEPLIEKILLKKLPDSSFGVERFFPKKLISTSQQKQFPASQQKQIIRSKQKQILPKQKQIPTQKKQAPAQEKSTTNRFQAENISKIKPRQNPKKATIRKKAIPPKLIKRISVKYPEMARRRKWTGRTLLRVEVLKDGKVGSVFILKSSGKKSLDNAAIDAVTSWIFHPAKKGAKIINSWIKIPIFFRL